MEAAGLGIFMISAAVVTAVLEHPASLIRQAISEALLRRFIIGVAMGLTAIAIIYSPWGKQSGAHINPVVTFTFLRLGKIKPTDALFYILAQFVGGLVGLLLAVRLLGEAIADPAVNKAVRCAKLHHHNNKRCIFRCGYRQPELSNGQWLLPK
ncbi:MAG: aquaporin [Cyanomargarita calcarea GSE-NOS-MK-12-04C]|uniref:Aquaporin n=1 Tax=Cyanomargarita calcarea GSE-NOS-MK-12-04C TaxID=2839659 RepID=A0A951QMN4_9CYAN|nr:aquaporin [Cyanomargarita calcarea GSE-NOS-MK-12-04C]